MRKWSFSDKTVFAGVSGIGILLVSGGYLFTEKYFSTVLTIYPHSPILLVLGLALFYLAAAIVVWHVRRSFGGLLNKYSPLLWAFCLASAAIMAITAFIPFLGVSGIKGQALLSFSISLFSNLIFFGLLSFLVFLLQQKEYEKERPIKDRIEALFNAKTEISVDALASIKKEIEIVACDHTGQMVQLKVLDQDSIGGLKLGVTRLFIVRNYTKDLVARYVPKVDITTDPQPLQKIGGEYHSLSWCLLKEGESSEDIFNGANETYIIDGRQVMPPDDVFMIKCEPIPIRAGEKYVFRARYDIWLPEGAKFGLTIQKHWDNVIFAAESLIDDNLIVDSRIMRGGKDAPLTYRRSLHSNAEVKCFEVQDLPLDSKIEIRFERKNNVAPGGVEIEATAVEEDSPEAKVVES